jgi:prevent-host-death family protein
MEISMAEAKARFAELVRIAEDGDEVILTRHGHPTAKIVPMKSKPKRDWDEIRRRVQEIQERVKAIEKPGLPDAAHSQDFLYDEYGLPK